MVRGQLPHKLLLSCLPVLQEQTYISSAFASCCGNWGHKNFHPVSDLQFISSDNLILEQQQAKASEEVQNC